jgi:Lsr2
VSTSRIATIGLGVSQSRISRIERGELDRAEIATLRSYVEALGGEVENRGQVRRRTHHGRLTPALGSARTTYRKLGFTTGPVQPRLPDLQSQKAVPSAASASMGTKDRQPRGPRPAAPTAQVRAWARSAGMAVPPRGRLSHEILAAYQDAHQKPAIERTGCDEEGADAR